MVLVKILLDIIQSAEITDFHRKQLIAEELKSNAHGTGHSEAASVYSMCLSRLVNNPEKSPVIPLYIISVYGHRYPNYLKHFATYEQISVVLHEEDPEKFVLIIAVLKEILQILNGDSEYMSSIGPISVILEEKFNFFGKNPKVLSKISELYILRPVLLPPESKRLAFTTSIMNHVASFPIPTKPETVRYMDMIGELVNSLWHSLALPEILETLMSMYQLISSIEVRKICPAMAHLLSLIDSNVVENLSPKLIASSNDRAFQQTLDRLTLWLVSWPTACQKIGLWIRTLVKELYKAGRHTVPTAVTKNNMPMLLRALNIPICRKGVISVVNVLLMSFKSDQVFHAGIPTIINLFKSLEAEGSDGAKDTLNQLVMICHCQMTMHSSSSNKYEELMKVLAPYPTPSIQVINNSIEEYDWPTTVKNQIAVVGRGLGRLVGQNSDQMSCQKRLPGQKSGLSNLGNTCYMNSVIQALFMTDDFRHCIMYSDQQSNRKLLKLLQKLFVLLSFSDRTCAAPRQFHDDSRPSWFSAGSQQDCSEYCRHLLVTLHEEERGNQKLPDYKEHMVIESETASIASDLQALPEDYAEKPSDDDLDPKDYVLPSDIVQCMTDEALIDTFPPESCDLPDSNAMKRKSSPEVPDLLLPKISRPEMPENSKEVDSSSDSGISGDLAEEMEVPLISPTGSPESGQEEPLPETEPNYFESVVQKVFGGKISTCIKCLNCKTESIHKDTFTDLNLTFEDRDHCSLADTIRKQPDRSSNEKTDRKAGLTIDDMINNYLKPETLSGDNQYQCERCARKQDAERSIRILESPNHLILTLLRFYYDTTKGQRQKVFTIADFKEHLYLPVHVSTPNDDRSETGSCPLDDNNIRWEKYALYGVVVHSGFSSEGGHYYCYARNSSVAALESELQKRYGLPGDWHNFNDDVVTPASFSNIERLTTSFIRDTPYILLYKKVNFAPNNEPNIPTDDINRLSPYLRDFVESQNLKKESNLSIYALSPSRRKDSDDQPPRSGGCGGSSSSHVTPPEVF